MLSMKDIDTFTLDIENGYFYWKCILKNDPTLYQIRYRIEPHITPRGNKSKRKIYFIEKNNQKLIFDTEAKKVFMAFKIPYSRCGI